MQITAIVDLQFGSTGKGLLAGYLAELERPDTVVCAWGPNAGHTFINNRGMKFVHIMVPNGVVSPALRQVMIGPGAVIDPEKMANEIMLLRQWGYDILSKLFIHENAAVVTAEDREAERVHNRIGSTQKGTAQAVINKLMRNPDLSAVAKGALRGDPMLGPRVVTADEYLARIVSANQMQIEGAQGFSLGINQRFYPYTTSRECTVQQVLIDCGIPRSLHKRVLTYGTLRTYPIRVANRFDAEGQMVGTSGPWYPDQRELQWEELGREPELTTVTKLPRRVFSFSIQQLEQALLHNAPEFLFLNFMNYLSPEAQVAFIEQVDWVANKYGARVRYLGFGPSSKDVRRHGR